LYQTNVNHCVWPHWALFPSLVHHSKNQERPEIFGSDTWLLQWKHFDEPERHSARKGKMSLLIVCICTHLQHLVPSRLLCRSALVAPYLEATPSPLCLRRWRSLCSQVRYRCAHLRDGISLRATARRSRAAQSRDARAVAHAAAPGGHGWPTSPLLSAGRRMSHSRTR
jgi:hypothetical protein